MTTLENCTFTLKIFESYYTKSLIFRSPFVLIIKVKSKGTIIQGIIYNLASFN